MSKLDVLDHGYVRLVDTMGTDLSVINAARVSFQKESLFFGDRDDRLLKFLVRERHTAPFRHAVVSLEAYAPLMVARQWWKYVIGSTHYEDATTPSAEGGVDPLEAWNESSRRYVTEEPTFYIPGHSDWRLKPENSKQGSSGFMPAESFTNEWHDWGGHMWTAQLQKYVAEGIRLYEDAMDSNIAPEQARLFLPAYGMYVRWRTTMSLQGVLHFLQERLEHDAQWEIQEFASAVHELVVEKFPKSFEAYGL